MLNEINVLKELITLTETMGPVVAMIVFIIYVTYIKPVSKDVIKPKLDFTAEEKLFLQDSVRDPIIREIRELAKDG